MRIFVFIIAGCFLFTGCRIIRQGEVGVVRKLGKISEPPLQAGPRLFNPVTTKIIKVPIRTVNLEVTLSLPSREGVNVEAEISILYSVDGSRATFLIEKIGDQYENSLILPVFRAGASDITARFMAKDMHTGNRAEIEAAIKEQMNGLLVERGIIIEAVLLKTIRLPAGLSRAIEEKLEAEQEAQRMEFILQREAQEAERRLIEARGIREANSVINEGLTPQILEYKSIEAFRELSKSDNTKIIFTDGKVPMLINPE